MIDKIKQPFFISMPALTEVRGVGGIVGYLRDMNNALQKNRAEFNRLLDVFVRGRLVSPNRVPTAHDDVTAEDLLYDRAFKSDGSEMYILVDKSGTLTWAQLTFTSTTW